MRIHYMMKKAFEMLKGVINIAHSKQYLLFIIYSLIQPNNDIDFSKLVRKIFS